MTTARRLALATSLALTGMFSAASASSPDLAGTWIGRTDVPDVGSVEVVLVLKKADAGYTATVSDSASLIAPDTAARDLEVEDDTLSFWFPLADGTTVSIRLKVSGDTMSGGWQHQEGETGSLYFERKKEK